MSDHHYSRTSPDNYDYVQQHQYEPHNNWDFVEPHAAMSIPTPQPTTSVGDLPYHRYDPPTNVHTVRTPYEPSYRSPVHRPVDAHPELHRSPLEARRIDKDPPVGDAGVTMDPRARTRHKDTSHYHNPPTTYLNAPHGYPPPHPDHYYAEAHPGFHRPPLETRSINRDFTFRDGDTTSVRGRRATLEDLTHRHNLPGAYPSTHTVRTPHEYAQTPSSIHYNIDARSGLDRSLLEPHPIHRDHFLGDSATIGTHDAWHTAPQSFYEKFFSLQLDPAPTHISSMLDSMITAVERGFSYDSIVSVPEIGLEDTRHRRRLVDWFDDGVDRFRTTGAAISRALTKCVRVRASPGLTRVTHQQSEAAA